jgi:hypothetical protein
MRLGVPFACFLGLLWGAEIAGAQDTDPSGGRLTVTTSAEDESISGRFSSADVTLDYASRMSSDGQALASVSGADGNVLAEAVVSRERATIIVAGVQITSETEVTEDEAMIVDAFSRTQEAAAIRALVTALADEIPPEARAKMSGLIAIGFMLGEGKGARTIFGDCFGCCGPGCWGCWLAGNCYTTACAVHDRCVELYGHKDRRCLALLAVAIVSYATQCL